MLYESISDSESAIDSYYQALHRCRAFPELKNVMIQAVSNLSLLLDKANKRDEAIQLLNSFGEEVEVLNNLGNIQKITGRRELAVQCYLKAIKIQPKAFLPNFNLATVYMEMEEYDKAL